MELRECGIERREEVYGACMSRAMDVENER